MEDTLRDKSIFWQINYADVLILVLMEDTLRGEMFLRNLINYFVLILVLMEDTLRVNKLNFLQLCKQLSLNPCFNGRYSQREEKEGLNNLTLGLNPCFNGRYSQRAYAIGLIDRNNES